MSAKEENPMEKKFKGEIIAGSIFGGIISGVAGGIGALIVGGIFGIDPFLIFIQGGVAGGFVVGFGYLLWKALDENQKADEQVDEEQKELEKQASSNEWKKRFTSKKAKEYRE